MLRVTFGGKQSCKDVGLGITWSNTGGRGVDSELQEGRRDCCSKAKTCKERRVLVNDDDDEGDSGISHFLGSNEIPSSRSQSVTSVTNEEQLRINSIQDVGGDGLWREEVVRHTIVILS
jgi:hypothetical protein